MYRRRYRYIPILSTKQILALLLVISAFFISYSLSNPLGQNLQASLTLLIAFGITTLVAILLVAFYIGRQRRARLRALQLVDIDNMPGVTFEHYVGELFKHQGYKIEFTKASGDFGMDIIATKDGVRTGVQIKRWKKKINREAISDVIASIKMYHCTQTMVITNNYFNKPAKTLAYSNNCVLIDRDKLNDWILNFQNRR